MYSAHFLAAVVVCTLPLAWTARAALSAMLLLSLALTVRRLRQPGIAALQVDSKGALSLQLRDGAWLNAEVLGSSLVTPWLTVLHLRPEEQRRTRHVVLMPDNLEADAYRQLRVWLKWGQAS